MGIVIEEFYKRNKECQEARKFAAFEMVTSAEYNTTDMKDKERVLASIIYLIETQGHNLGNYKTTCIDGCPEVELYRLTEDVENFTFWDIVPEIKDFLSQNKEFADLTNLLSFLYFSSVGELPIEKYYITLAMLCYYVSELGYSEEEAFKVIDPYLGNRFTKEVKGLLLIHSKSFEKKHC